jgi:predicted nucleotidyltransferase
MAAVLSVPIQRILDEVVQRLIVDYQPERIILYGSYAYGTPDADSDLDLLIIKATDASPLERRVQVRRILAQPTRRIPLSSLVLTPDELSQRLRIHDPFITDIIRQAETLYVRE